ncbi:MAG: SWIM zinc finger family protein [Candidatus Nitrosocosmicus sp.]|nr:SWIM zinc finger domain-containing protein [Candidatus Nitrosocosmicus sp.]
MSSVLIAPKMQQIDIDKYLVNSFNPKKPTEQYEVTVIVREERTRMPLIGSCSCPHFTYRNVQCKHIMTVFKELVKQ